MSKAEIKRTHKIIYQKLTLDKLNYKVSDSPYGKIDFKSVEIARRRTTKNFENFRTKNITILTFLH
jgi:hypothetical protein